MIIVFGVSKDAEKFILKNKENANIVCYDNDRRKWGKLVAGVRIITLSEYLDILENVECKIIVTIDNITALFFLRDTCDDRHKIFMYMNDDLEKIDLSEISNDFKELERKEQKKLNKYRATLSNGFLKNKEIASRYEKYVEKREQNHSWPEIAGVELTNFCNLRCPNCPTPTCKRPKGYMSDEVFYKSLEYITPDMDAFFSMHGLGEPLLHPKFLKYLNCIVKMGKPVLVSTNGILLNKDMANDMLDIMHKASKCKLFISFHTKTSVENWKATVDILLKKGIKNIELYGQVLEHNEEESKGWLRELGVDDFESNEYIRYVTSHSFAGSVEGKKNKYTNIEVKNRFRNCTYIQNNTTLVAWDGRLKACCLDAELEGIGGTIFDIESLCQRDVPYNICHCCDPDWTSNYQ